jgi:hypothetical protein
MARGVDDTAAELGREFVGPTVAGRTETRMRDAGKGQPFARGEQSESPHYVCVRARRIVCVEWIPPPSEKKYEMSLHAHTYTHTNTHTQTHTHAQLYRGQSRDSGRSFALAKTGDAHRLVPAPRPSRKKIIVCVELA